MDKENSYRKEEICFNFNECFGYKSKKKTIWRCKDNIPVKDGKLFIHYKNGCDTLEIYINGSTSPIQILRPGESFKRTFHKLTSIDIYCNKIEQVSYSSRRNPCNCKPEYPVHKPCCCRGSIEITKYHKKPCKPKTNFALILVLFILLVIVGCSCSNKHYYPMC
ncbi:YjcZ family sporulation protein [Mycoplasmatota bacterium WC44]